MEIGLAQPADLATAEALLRRNGLPVDGLAAHTQTLLVARDEGRVLGTSALELYTDGALLRSVFPRFGFERITREDVPATVRTSIEFTSVCCASAVVMRTRLR